MPALDRQISQRGPKFFRQDGRLMFVHHIDGSTRDGPREATEADRKAHEALYRAFTRKPAP